MESKVKVLSEALEQIGLKPEVQKRIYGIDLSTEEERRRVIEVWNSIIGVYNSIGPNPASLSVLTTRSPERKFESSLPFAMTDARTGREHRLLRFSLEVKSTQYTYIACSEPMERCLD